MEDDDQVALDHSSDDSPELEESSTKGGWDTQANPLGHTRRVSDKTRELLKSAAGELKKQFDANDEVPAIDTDESAASPGEPTSEATSVKSLADAAGLPKPDPLAEQARQRFEAKLMELEKREATLTERETASDLDTLRDEYIEKPSHGFRKFYELLYGKTSDEDFKDEVADLVTDLSANILGVEIDPTFKSRIDSKRAIKSVKQYKQAMTAKEQKMAKQREADEQAQVSRGHINALNSKFAEAEMQKSYPFLTIKTQGLDPGQIVYDMITAEYEKNGTILQWQKAAELADNFLKEESYGWYNQRKHLLTATANSSDTKASERHQVKDPQGISRSKTLTNALASSTTTTKADNSVKQLHGAARRERSLNKVRTMFKSSDD